MNPALLAIIGLSVLSLIGGGLVVALEVLRPDGVNTNATYTIIGIITPTMAVLLAWLKQITSERKTDAKIESKGEEIKREIQSAPVKIDDAAASAKAVIAVAAEKAADKLERTADAAASRLAPPKGA